MTGDEVQAARDWLTHYAAHLNTLDHDTRNAVRTAAFCLARLEENPSSIAAADELTTTMTGLRAAVARRPVLAPLPEALTTGEFLPLDQLRALGVDVPRRGWGPGIIRVHSKWSIWDLRPRRWT